MKRVIIIGAGMAGLASAYLLSKHGVNVVLAEKGERLGGLAASFEINGKFIPRGYHHILSKDANLVEMIKELHLYEKAKWKHIKFVFWKGRRYYNLSNPIDLIKFPMGFFDKITFVRFMLYCFAKRKWNNLEMDAKTWLDMQTNPRVREAIFEPMTRIKFGVGTDKVSASWLGSRLHSREGSSLFGYIPDSDWANHVIDAFEKEIIRNNGAILKKTSIQEIVVKNNKITGVIADGKHIQADAIISTLPIYILKKICNHELDVPDLEYITTISCLVGINEKLDDFYWMVCADPKMSFGGIFQLNSLNPTIGFNETVLNFFANVDKDSPLIAMNEEDIFRMFAKDFKKLFNLELNPNWVRVFKIYNSSPKFLKGYVNPPIETNIKGLYLAGAYKEYPMLTSTGTAIFSGIKTAKKILNDIYS